MAQSTRYSLKQLFQWFTLFSLALGSVVAFGLRGVAGVMLALSLWMIRQGYRKHLTGVGCLGYLMTVPSAFFLYSAIMWHQLTGGGPIDYPEDYPRALAEIVRTNGRVARNVRAHRLGGFIDSEYVWRIDLPSTLRDTFVTDHRLVAVDTANVPAAFFEAFPRRWRLSHTSECEYFATPGFPATGRGPDGDHYFMMYDRKLERMYVWLKSNF